MRDIIFKAKRIDNGEWVEGAYFPKTKYPTKKNRTFIWVWQIGKIYCDYNCGYSPYEVDKKTICQYTGLTDKNGNKIWENDIVNKVDTNGLGYHRERKCKVSFDELGYWLLTTEYGDGYWLGEFDSEQLEVIGNIFDNPELLNYVDNEVSQQAHQEVLKPAT